MSKYKFLVVAFFFVTLAGCASQDIPDPDPADSTFGSEDGANTGGMDVNGLNDGEEIPFDPAGGELADIVYFDFDSFELDPDATEVAARHGRQLSDNSYLSVRLEGHADERGTREYNMALGERRANSVRDFLVSNGVSRSQLETVSYGEESPASRGSSESSYSKNRRVELK